MTNIQTTVTIAVAPLFVNEVINLIRLPSKKEGCEMELANITESS